MLSQGLIKSPSWTVVSILSIALGCCQLSIAQQLVQSSTLSQTQASANVTIGTKSPPGLSAQLSNELKNFEEFKKSPLFVEPFDPKVIRLPEPHLAFVRKVIEQDNALYRTILKEAIEKRNKLGASLRLMLKYGGRIIGNFVSHRREEKKLTQKIEPKPEFYLMLADLCTEIANVGSQMKKNYSKKTLNIERFRSRVESLLDNIEQTVKTSPLGTYMKWSNYTLYKDRPKNGIQNRRLAEEAADLVAQFQAMGYDTTNFMIRQMANLARMFARGVVPGASSV